MPLYRILPRRGFSNAKFKTEYSVVNVSDLEKITDGGVIDREALVNAGLVRKNARLIKILGNGKLEKAVKVNADMFSATARSKIESAGGEAIVPVKETAEKAGTEGK